MPNYNLPQAGSRDWIPTFMSGVSSGGTLVLLVAGNVLNKEQIKGSENTRILSQRLRWTWVGWMGAVTCYLAYRNIVARSSKTNPADVIPHSSLKSLKERQAVQVEDDHKKRKVSLPKFDNTMPVYPVFRN